ncbi:MerR family transcriptional regulator [Kibdelosporangium persicum]|uniref:Redox-sensitive transcriptional activator SoxR n=2 Tax=Kibdelosporangium persicum TaxID=2698649 RepID=A0ABX2EWW4_9PSEU|nr:Redox-sensitive transcriptional activator SoxR [Kibdelosporangium persicum]
MLGLNVDMKSSEIGPVAARFGLATHVLRHWESVGLLAPERQGDRRRYRQDDLDRIAIILHAKEAGFSLEDIREMFVDGDPADRKEIMRRHRADLAERIAALQAALALVEKGLACEHEDITQCPTFLRAIGLARSPR